MQTLTLTVQALRDYSDALLLTDDAPLVLRQGRKGLEADPVQKRLGGLRSLILDRVGRPKVLGREPLKVREESVEAGGGDVVEERAQGRVVGAGVGDEE